MGARYSSPRARRRSRSTLCATSPTARLANRVMRWPVTLPYPEGVKVVRVDTAHEMLAATLAALPADIAICAAAVADWRAADEAPQKLKKQPDGSGPSLKLAANPDILATIAAPGENRPRLVVGFAA